MKILPTTVNDFPDWLGMRRELYTGLDEGFHRQEVEAILASDVMAAFVGVSDVGDGTIGMLELSLRNVVDGCVGGPVGYIEGLYIKPQFRGRGFGRQMVAFAESWFISSGCHEMATDAELDNTAAQAFHRAVGFEETFRIVEYRKRLLDEA
jgi:aminoglycoside 6'-N-acetyltransferase I